MLMHVLTVGLLMLVAPSPVQQDTPRNRPALDAVAQPPTWVAFQSIVEHNDVRVGRFYRDGNGSTRLELELPDERGRTIIIHNIPQARYYVYRLADGWTSQPMLLPTHGWLPPPVTRADAGEATETPLDGLTVWQRVKGGVREQRAPLLNFFPIVREQPDGVVERHRGIRVGDVPATLFVPPPGANVTELSEPGGIVALPSRNGGQQ